MISLIHIDQIIRELLFVEDCVILPGFGAFVSNYKAAEIREETQTFIPPTKEIGFNIDLQDDDGLLVKRIADHAGIEHEEATRFVDDKVNDYKRRLRKGEKVSIEGVGYFIIHRNSDITFKAAVGVNFLVDSFGFSTFNFPVLEEDRKNFLSRGQLFRSPEPKVKEVLPGTKERKVTRGDSAVKWAAVTIPAILLLSLIPYNARISSSLFKHPASLGPLPALKDIAPPITNSSITPADTFFFEMPVVNTEKEIRKQAETELPDDQPGLKKYPIIAGSFSSSHYARKLIDDLKGRGFQADQMTAPNGQVRVVAESHENLNQARTALADIRVNHPDLSVWILQ